MKEEVYPVYCRRKYRGFFVEGCILLLSDCHLGSFMVNYDIKILHFLSSTMIFIFVSLNEQKSCAACTLLLILLFLLFFSILISGVTKKFPEIFYLNKQYQSKLEN